MKKPIGATLLLTLAVMASASRGVSAIPKKDAWYAQHSIIMQDFERKLYSALSVNGRAAFQELFWPARTRDARATFQARLEYVKKTFWKENSHQPWNTDRSRVYLLNGSPAAIDVDQNVDFASAFSGQMVQATGSGDEDIGANWAEAWTYSHNRYFITYYFTFIQPNQWKRANLGDRYQGEFEDYSKNVIFGIADLERYKQDLAALKKI